MLGAPASRTLSRVRSPLAHLLSLAVCAATSQGCYRSQEPADAAAACPPRVRACDAWEPDGAPTALATGEALRVGDVLAQDCAVVALWADDDGVSVHHVTRVIDWTGVPVSEPTILADLTFDRAIDTHPRLTRGAGGVSALVTGPEGCVWAPLDLDGRLRGPVAPIGDTAGRACRGFGPAPDGTSFLSSRSPDHALSLWTLDEAGAVTERQPIGPLGAEATTRLDQPDGTFLVGWRERAEPGAPVETTLRRFDASGRPRGPMTGLGQDVSRLVIAATRTSPILFSAGAGADGLPLRIQPIDHDGRRRGESRTVPAEQVSDLAAARAFSGDLLLAWMERRADAPSRLRTLAVEPRGTPAGPVVDIPAEDLRDDLRLVIHSGGARALLLYSDTHHVRAQPLRCAHF